jgi:hypothetical protein
MLTYVDIDRRPLWPDCDGFEQATLAGFRASYMEAAPFPHLVIDDLFSSATVGRLMTAFGEGTNTGWREFRGSLQRKRGTTPGAPLPPLIQEYFNFIYSGPFLRLLTKITGIEDLIPDPALYGGGMHEVNAGGHFEVHLDFRTHPRTRLTNRLVVITYLNENWTAGDGGALELWDLEPPRCVATIQPLAGRTVIMEQSGRAAHGHPDPVREGLSRRSVIAYFYTNGHAVERDDSLATVYVPSSEFSRAQLAELLLRRLMPPPIVKGLRTLRGLLT